MNYIYRVISFLVLAVLFIGCGSDDKNNKNKPNSKTYSSSQSCSVETRSIFKNINAPVFGSTTSVNIYEGKKNVFTIVATPKNGGSISYLICGRGSEFFDIGSSDGKITFKVTSSSIAGSSYDIVVKATDSNDARTTSQIFTINILPAVKPNIEDVESKSFLLDNEITPIEFANTGGAITSCTTTPPSLPTGLKVELSLTTENCVLSGTPTASSSSTDYNITAKNSSGEDNATINITTSQLAPIISDTILSTVFSGETVGASYIQNLSSEPWEFNNTGGDITRCEINATLSPSVTALPTGLTLADDCTIAGTPTTQALGWFTIEAWNSDGVKSNPLDVSIQVKSKGLTIDSISDEQKLIVGQAMTPINFGPDEILYCGISHTSPALPSGLTIVANKTDKTCKITGTPTNTKISAAYTIRATNTLNGGGSTVTIVVNPPAPIIADIATKNLVVGTLITPISFTNTGGILTSCSSTPLPTGLNVALNGNTCEINGTPSVATALREYNITATNSGGEDNASITLAIANPSPPSIADITTTNNLTVGIKMTPIMFINTGGISTSCSSIPSLPAGLNIGTNGTTCEINGTAPSVAIALREYNITATNLGGEDNASINIAIVP